MQYIACQQVRSWSQDKPPYGPFAVRQVKKITPKCVFINERWSSDRLHKDSIRYKVFDDEQSALAWVSEVLGEKVPRLKSISKEADEAARAAKQELSAALVEAGLRADWDE